MAKVIKGVPPHLSTCLYDWMDRYEPSTPEEWREFDEAERKFWEEVRWLALFAAAQASVSCGKVIYFH